MAADFDLSGDSGGYSADVRAGAAFRLSGGTRPDGAPGAALTSGDETGGLEFDMSGQEQGQAVGHGHAEFQLTDDTPVYVISVAAQLCGMHPQTLRAYDRLGLVSPGRAAGRGRRYSLREVLLLREVQRLSQQEGVNLSGIKRILELESQSQRSRMMLAQLGAEISQLRSELESTRAVAARLARLLRSRHSGGTLVPVHNQAARPAPASGPPGAGEP